MSIVPAKHQHHQEVQMHPVKDRWITQPNHFLTKEIISNMAQPINHDRRIEE